MDRQTNMGDSRLSTQIASDVWWLVVGKGLMRSNVYFVRSAEDWVLVDAGARNCAPAIVEAGRRLFGPARPVSIVLTHDHPDHAGSAKQLADEWACSIWVHPAELPIVAGDMAALRRYAGPLDRWVILPLLRLQGAKRTRAIIGEATLGDRVRPLAQSEEPPGMSGWKIVHTPGHTPGHISLFRGADQVLITGDALLTVDLNSVSGVIRPSSRLSGPPWYTTWDWTLAKRSVTTLLGLDPRVVAGGHGTPICRPLPGQVASVDDELRPGDELGLV